MKIYGDVLSAIKAETRKGEVVLTRIQLKTNVPFDRLKAYLSDLEELGLVQDGSLLRLTEKGQQYVVEYERVLDFMKRMGLCYR
jgi:predicted transcriptional regulator